MVEFSLHGVCLSVRGDLSVHGVSLCSWCVSLSVQSLHSCERSHSCQIEELSDT